MTAISHQSPRVPSVSVRVAGGWQQQRGWGVSCRNAPALSEAPSHIAAATPRAPSAPHPPTLKKAARPTEPPPHPPPHLCISFFPPEKVSFFPPPSSPSRPSVVPSRQPAAPSFGLRRPSGLRCGGLLAAVSGEVFRISRARGASASYPRANNLSWALLTSIAVICAGGHYRPKATTAQRLPRPTIPPFL